jgi:tRNA 2-(methylsulfanyl)-N6-isopentenyladenosine37 hydroxylase
MLGLREPTNPRWAGCAADDLASVLVDHAHCEMKAASNALALSARAVDHPRVLRTLAELAEEEISHFRHVVAELDRLGITLGPPAPDRYAAELLRVANATAKKRGPRDALSDRLLVGALIEARSCERFKLLGAELARRAATGAPTKIADLAAFYEDLLAAEARHHRVFVELAEEVSGSPAKTRTRLAEIAELEARIVKALPVGPTIHG